tara:strand:- start:200 stop:931 length:732 start_codon:yes stop_codon:yes gene_type:complete
MEGGVLEGGMVKQSSLNRFSNHVFDFGEDSKQDIMNLLQFGILSLIPLVLLNKTMNRYVPEASYMKGTFELVFEIVGQTGAMLIGLVFIERLVTFIPTLSGKEYEKVNRIVFILPFLMILLSIQSKLGDKANILYKRAVGILGGNQFVENMEDEEEGSGNGQQQNGPVVSQPLSQQQGNGMGPPPPVVSSNRTANIALQENMENRPSLTAPSRQHSAQNSAPPPVMGPSPIMPTGFSEFGSAF